MTCPLQQFARILPSSLTHFDFSHVLKNYAQSAPIRLIRWVVVRQPLPDRQRPAIRFQGLGRLIHVVQDFTDANETRGQLSLEFGDGGVVARYPLSYRLRRLE